MNLMEKGADIDVTHKEGGNLLTEFAGEGWDDLLKQLVDEAVAGFTGGENGTCLEPPLLHAFYVNQLFWTWVHTLEVSGVMKDADGKETTIPLGHVKSEPFSFVSKQAWKNSDGKVIASSHQDAITTVTKIGRASCRERV